MSKLINSHLIGQTIKHLRQSKRWTQEQLAEAVGYSVRNLRRIENEGAWSIDVVNTFAGIFEISAIDILDGDVFCFLGIYLHTIDSLFGKNSINIGLYTKIIILLN